jgi:HSP20 family protein
MFVSIVMRPDPFSTEMSRLFDTLLTGSDGLSQQRWSPAMDLVEADDHFVLKADVPGMSEDDVRIEIRDNALTVSGERKAEHERSERGWHRVERSFGRFSRTLTLPEGIDPDAVTASFARGVLSVRIPKPAERRPRVVTVSPDTQQATVEATARGVGGGDADPAGDREPESSAARAS